MSAIMFGPEHFNVLIWTAIHAAPMVPSERNLVTNTTAESTPYNGVRNWGAAGRVRELTAGTETVYGQMLVDANAAAVNGKYGEDNAYVYAYSRPKSTEWTPREVLSALDGFEYQACEVEDASRGSEPGIDLTATDGTVESYLAVIAGQILDARALLSCRATEYDQS